MSRNPFHLIEKYNLQQYVDSISFHIGVDFTCVPGATSEGIPVVSFMFLHSVVSLPFFQRQEH